MTPSLPPQTGQVWTSLLLTKILNFFLQIISYCVIITIPFLGHHNTTSSFGRGRRRTVVFLFSPQCQLVVMLALYTTSHGQSKGPKMVAPGQCRRANGGQKRLAKTNRDKKRLGFLSLSQSSFSVLPAAIFIFLPAAAGAGIVSPHRTTQNRRLPLNIR